MHFKIILAAATAFFVAGSAAVAAANKPAEEGAFMTVMVQASDVGAYRDYLKANPEAFNRTGAAAGGICIVKSGHAYPGEAFGWAAYPSVKKALQAVETFDPTEADPALAALRTVKYVAVWKPITPFRLDPGFERVERVKIAPNNVEAYRQQLMKTEAAVQKAGHKDFFVGMLQSLGGGPREAGTFMIRGITRDGASYGKIADEYYAGAPWAVQNLPRLQSLVEDTESDAIEVCEQFYTAE